MRKLLLMLMVLLPAARMSAQDDPQYRMEIGAGVGTVSYEGDFNGNVLKNMQPMFSALWRYNFDPYKDLRLSATYGKLKGSSKDVDTYYPDYATEEYSFNRNLLDVSLVFEYNFWPYGTGRDYRGAKRLTPYIYGGPWSGKTPCYRNVKAPLGAVTRIDRASANSIEKLNPVNAFANLLPACSSMKWDKRIFDNICNIVTKIVETTGIYILHCLPDKEAAIICNRAISK